MLKHKKTIRITIVSILAVFGLAFFVLQTRASVLDNVSGWLWGGSEEAQDNIINGNETGVGAISMDSSDPKAGGGPYSVAIDETGKVSGYAWSENIGWIDFDPQDHCGLSTGYPAASCTPPSGSAGVSRSGDNLTGWARVVGIAQESAVGNAGGWEGWLQMDNVKIADDPDTPDKIELAGYAWNGETAGSGGLYADGLGAVSFEKASIKASPKFIVCPDSLTLLLPKSGAPKPTGQLHAEFWSTLAENPDCDTAGFTDVTADSGTNWHSDNSDIPVNNTDKKGLVTGKAVGTANITATYKNLTTTVSASATVSVVQQCSYTVCNASSHYECVEKLSVDPCPIPACSIGPPAGRCDPSVFDKNWREVAP